MVTGVGGFLGSTSALRYLKLGHDVVGIDNFCSSFPNSLHLQTLKTFLKFKFFEQDISDENFEYDHFCLENRYDLILNFACPASPPVYQKIPIDTMMTCTLGVKNVFNVARRHSSKVVHMSTSEVYGDPEVNPQPESYRGNVNSYGPRSCYDSGKRASEAIAWDYRHLYNVDIKVVRIFNTYGPNMQPDDGRVISNFINQALNDEDLTVYGDGSQTRSCCYVDDLLRGIEQVASMGVEFSGPVNLGNPEEYTILEVAQQVLDKIPESKSKIVYKDLPVDDPKKRKPDITMAMNVLGWVPKVCLDKGLDLTIKYFRENM